jgi:hypothetical protein
LKKINKKYTIRYKEETPTSMKKMTLKGEHQ